MPKRTKAPPHPALNTIRDNIRKGIAEQGYSSVEKFSHENGLEQSVLSRFLTGRNDILLSTYLRIAGALDMGADPSVLANGLPSVDEQGNVRINLSTTPSVQIFASVVETQPLFAVQKNENTSALSCPVFLYPSGKAR